MLKYLFRAPSIFTMREARTHFIEDDELLVPDAGYIQLEDGDIWRRRRTRGVARQMHAWFFYYFLRPCSDPYDEKIARKLINLLAKWREIVELPPTRIPMAYHDEATAQRVIALSCMLIDYAPLLTDEDHIFVKTILTENTNLLADDEFHSRGTNHGMYQDLALIVASEHLSNGARLMDLAVERLNDYFFKAFTPDGIHIEQSPEYHYIVSNHLREYASFLASQDSSTSQRLEQIFKDTENYAIMAISPLGKFPPVSDTSNELVISREYSHAYPSQEYAYALTQGLLGTVPKNNQYIASNSGVAVYREDWQDPDSVYLYFSSAYNSDYHKHSDELSLYLIHRGIEVLREAGPNGYDMENPYTEYGFSSFSHNTLIVNGKGLPRTDPESMHLVGLQASIHGDDTIATTDSDTAVCFAAEGWNHRFVGVEHHRGVRFLKSDNREAPKTVSICDTVRADRTNNYQLLWHFGPTLSADLLYNTVRLRDREGALIGELRVTADTAVDLELVAGQSEPKVQGWYFPEMGVCEPTQTLILSFKGETTEIQTDITLMQSSRNHFKDRH